MQTIYLSHFLLTVPSAPEDFRYEPTDASTIRLKWDTPDGPPDGIKKYEILFTLDKTKPLSKWEVQEVDGESDVGMVRIEEIQGSVLRIRR